MTAKEVLIKNTDTTVIHNSGVYGRTMISEECALKAMEEYAKQKVAEAERAAFEAAREQEIVGEGYDQEIKFKYETIEDWRNHDPSGT
jgi:diphthamide biosynthesis methyltransferase